MYFLALIYAYRFFTMPSLSSPISTAVKTIRKRMLTSYKEHRTPVADDLVWQVQQIPQVVEALGITWAGAPGYEGDDVIGTLCANAERICKQRERMQAMSDAQVAALTMATAVDGEQQRMVAGGREHDATIMEQLRKALDIPSDSVGNHLNSLTSSSPPLPYPIAKSSGSLLSLAEGSPDDVPIDHVYILSHDKDFMQLVSPHVTLVRPTSGTFTYLTPQGVEDLIGVRPDQFCDYLAMVGDASDNIPGVPGIGPKTAVKLLQDHGTGENVMKMAAETFGLTLAYHSRDAFDRDILDRLAQSEDLTAITSTMIKKTGGAAAATATTTATAAATAAAAEGGAGPSVESEERELDVIALAAASTGNKRTRSKKSMSTSIASDSGLNKALKPLMPGWGASPRIAALLMEHNSSFWLSRMLAHIERNVPNMPSLASLRFENFDNAHGGEVLQSLGIFAVTERFRRHSTASFARKNAERRKREADQATAAVASTAAAARPVVPLVPPSELAAEASNQNAAWLAAELAAENFEHVSIPTSSTATTATTARNSTTSLASSSSSGNDAGVDEGSSGDGVTVTTAGKKSTTAKRRSTSSSRKKNSSDEAMADATTPTTVTASSVTATTVTASSVAATTVTASAVAGSAAGSAAGSGAAAGSGSVLPPLPLPSSASTSTFVHE